jgi:galactokinase
VQALSAALTPEPKMIFASHLVKAGMSEEEAFGKQRLFERSCSALGVPPDGGDGVVAIFVPGRIEVLGKHTDYAGGRSLVCAAERGFCAVARARDDREVHAVDVVSGARARAALDPGPAPAADWGLYVATAAVRVARNFPEAGRGADIAFGSDLPMAAGMSSSSALMTSVVLLVVAINNLQATARYRDNVRNLEDLAEYLGTIENGQDFRALAGDAGVGTSGGSEDHTAMLCCTAGEMSQYSFCPVRHERQVPVPAGHRFVVGVSGVVAEKTGAARDTYNRASLAARRVLELWRAASGHDAPSLGAAVEKWGREDFAFLRAPRERFAALSLVDRFEQFCDETFDIIPRVGDCLLEGRVEEISDLVDRSQRGAERGLGNQVPETVFLAESARAAGAVAASAFGAGFGGSVWALVAADTLPGFCREWSDRYRTAFPRRSSRAHFFTTRAGPSALRILPVVTSGNVGFRQGVGSPPGSEP